MFFFNHLNLSNFGLCGFCSSKSTNTFSRNSSISINNSTSNSSLRGQKVTQCNSNASEITGVLHIQRLGVTNEEKEWHKSVVILKNGIIEMIDLENDIVDKFDLKGYNVLTKPSITNFFELNHPKSSVVFHFEMRDEGTLWLQFNGQVITNSISFEQWQQYFNRNIDTANRKRRRNNYNGPYQSNSDLLSVSSSGSSGILGSSMFLSPRERVDSLISSSASSVNGTSISNYRQNSRHDSPLKPVTGALSSHALRATRELERIDEDILLQAQVIELEKSWDYNKLSPTLKQSVDDIENSDEANEDFGIDGRKAPPMYIPFVEEYKIDDREEDNDNRKVISSNNNERDTNTKEGLLNDSEVNILPKTLSRILLKKSSSSCKLDVNNEDVRQSVSANNSMLQRFRKSLSTSIQRINIDNNNKNEVDEALGPISVRLEYNTVYTILSARDSDMSTCAGLDRDFLGSKHNDKIVSISEHNRSSNTSMVNPGFQNQRLNRAQSVTSILSDSDSSSAVDVIRKGPSPEPRKRFNSTAGAPVNSLVDHTRDESAWSIKDDVITNSTHSSPTKLTLVTSRPVLLEKSSVRKRGQSSPMRCQSISTSLTVETENTANAISESTKTVIETAEQCDSNRPDDMDFPSLGCSPQLSEQSALTTSYKLDNIDKHMPTVLNVPTLPVNVNSNQANLQQRPISSPQKRPISLRIQALFSINGSKSNNSSKKASPILWSKSTTTTASLSQTDQSQTVQISSRRRRNISSSLSTALPSLTTNSSRYQTLPLPKLYSQSSSFVTDSDKNRTRAKSLSRITAENNIDTNNINNEINKIQSNTWWKKLKNTKLMSSSNMLSLTPSSRTRSPTVLQKSSNPKYPVNFLQKVDSDLSWDGNEEVTSFRDSVMVGQDPSSQTLQDLPNGENHSTNLPDNKYHKITNSDISAMGISNSNHGSSFFSRIRRPQNSSTTKKQKTNKIKRPIMPFLNISSRQNIYTPKTTKMLSKKSVSQSNLSENIQPQLHTFQEDDDDFQIKTSVLPPLPSSQKYIYFDNIEHIRSSRKVLKDEFDDEEFEQMMIARDRNRE